MVIFVLLIIKTIDKEYREVSENFPASYTKINLKNYLPVVSPLETIHESDIFFWYSRLVGIATRKGCIDHGLEEILILCRNVWGEWCTRSQRKAFPGSSWLACFGVFRPFFLHRIVQFFATKESFTSLVMSFDVYCSFSLCNGPNAFPFDWLWMSIFSM